MNAAALIAHAKQVFNVEIEGLERTRDSVGESFVRAVELLLTTTEAGGLAIVTGVGKNLHVAEKFSAILASTGTRSVVLNPVQAMHGDLGLTSARDVLVALSFSGESEEVVRLIPSIRRHGLKVIALTGNPGSSLANLADIHVAIPCGREACPFGMAPTTSATATMAMGDALAMALVEVRGFSLEAYAGNHPAGAIGRALLLKASDVMRTGEALARVSASATVLETVVAMTAAKGGAAVITDADGRLCGIFTDGDFRREASKASDCGRLLASEVAAVMTPSPQFVRADAYAADLLKVFERLRIDDLPVCDDSGRVVGIVDLQDLPKMKVL